MAKFVLTAQLQLRSPSSGEVRRVVTDIERGLTGVKVDVAVEGSKKATAELKKVEAATTKAANSADKMGRAFAVSIKRFAAFSIATRAIGLLTRGIGGAVEEAIEFERQLIKVSQVTGKTMRQLKGLTDEITRLSTSLGVSSKALLGVTRVLAQAGLSARDTKVALEALAKSTLAATFEDINQTAEGAVAIFNQFGKGAKALEGQLGAINAVAGQFAVEAGDLIAVIRRTGGVFKNAGGDLNELIALFTSVRSTTREAAESIATGLRTIFTRIQRPSTIKFLKTLGVELTNAEGKFVGPFKAIQRLSDAMGKLEPGDLKFVRIAEVLGGFRQIGKVIPLLQQMAVSQEALKVAMAGTNSLTDDAAKAQKTLAVRITKVKEEWLALVRGIADSPTFKIMANTALSLASALIKVAEAMKPILPLMAAFAGFKLFTGLKGFVGGLRGGLSSAGAGVPKFAAGGLVPGQGNRDTVPAMLTPGEFVIKKSSVNSIGTSRLSKMNKYAGGGKIALEPRQIGMFSIKEGRNQGKEPGKEWQGGGSKVLKAVTNRKFFEKIGMGDAMAGLEMDPAQRRKHFKKKAYRARGGLKDTTWAPPGPYRRGFTDEEIDALPIEKINKEYERDTKAGVVPAVGKGKKDWNKFGLVGRMAGFYMGRFDKDQEKRADIHAQVGEIVQSSAADGLAKAVKDSVKAAVKDNLLDLPNDNIKMPKWNPTSKSTANLLDAQSDAVSIVQGFVTEGLISATTGATVSGGGVGFDYTKSSMENPDVRKKLGLIFGAGDRGIGPLVKADAKLSMGEEYWNSLGNKLIGDINRGNFEGVNLSGTAHLSSLKGGKAKAGSQTILKYLKQQGLPEPVEARLGGLIQRMEDGGAAVKKQAATQADKIIKQHFAVSSDTIGFTPASVFGPEGVLSEAILKNIRTNFVAGPSGVGKTTKTAQMGASPLKALRDIDKAAQLTFEIGGQKIQKYLPLIEHAKKTGGFGVWMSKSPEAIAKQRQDRIKKAEAGKGLKFEKRSVKALKGAAQHAPLATPDMLASLQKAFPQLQVDRVGMAKGGQATDTVPALLTPGEFVVNKKSAQSIGYGKLESMNSRGVEGFATGGIVGRRRFANGGSVNGEGMGVASDKLVAGAMALSIAAPMLGDAAKQIFGGSKEANAMIDSFVKNLLVGIMMFAMLAKGLKHHADKKKMAASEEEAAAIEAAGGLEELDDATSQSVSAMGDLSKAITRLAELIEKISPPTEKGKRKPSDDAGVPARHAATGGDTSKKRLDTAEGKVVKTSGDPLEEMPSIAAAAERDTKMDRASAIAPSLLPGGDMSAAGAGTLKHEGAVLREQRKERGLGPSAEARGGRSRPAEEALVDAKQKQADLEEVREGRNESVEHGQKSLAGKARNAQTRANQATVRRQVEEDALRGVSMEAGAQQAKISVPGVSGFVSTGTEGAMQGLSPQQQRRVMAGGAGGTGLGHPGGSQKVRTWAGLKQAQAQGQNALTRQRGQIEAEETAEATRVANRQAGLSPTGEWQGPGAEAAAKKDEEMMEQARVVRDKEAAMGDRPSGRGSKNKKKAWDQQQAALGREQAKMAEMEVKAGREAGTGAKLLTDETEAQEASKSKLAKLRASEERSTAKLSSTEKEMEVYVSRAKEVTAEDASKARAEEDAAHETAQKASKSSEEFRGNKEAEAEKARDDALAKAKEERQTDRDHAQNWKKHQKEKRKQKDIPLTKEEKVAARGTAAGLQKQRLQMVVDPEGMKKGGEMNKSSKELEKSFKVLGKESKIQSRNIKMQEKFVKKYTAAIKAGVSPAMANKEAMKKALGPLRRFGKTLDATKGKLKKFGAQMREKGGGSMAMGMARGAGGFMKKNAGQLSGMAMAGVQAGMGMWADGISRELAAFEAEGDIEGMRAKMQEQNKMQTAQGVMTGMMGGAAMGAFLGPLGMAAGAVIGGVGAWYMDNSEAREKENEQKLQEMQVSETGKVVGKNIEKIQKAGMDPDVMQEMEKSIAKSNASIKANLGQFGDKKKKKMEDELKKQSVAVAAAYGGQAKSMEELKGHMDGLNVASPKYRDEMLKAAKSAFMVAQSMRALAVANADLLKITSMFGAAQLAVDNYINSMRTGVSAFAQVAATLNAAQKNIAMGEGGVKAVKDAKAMVFERTGLSQDSEVGKSLNRSFDTMEKAAKVTAAIPGNLKDVKITGKMTDEGIKDELTAKLLPANLKGTPIGDVIEGSIEGLTEPQLNAIRNGTMDLSVALGDMSGKIAKLSGGVMASVNAMLKHETQMAKLTQMRVKSEQSLIAAQQQSIQLSMQASQIIAKHGGTAVTPDMKRQSIMDQANVNSRRLGLSKLGTGSGAELASRSRQILGRFAGQETTSRGGGFTGPEGVDRDKRSELKRELASLVSVTQQLIKADEEALGILQKKNALEKSSLEALVSGDLDKFFKEQAAVGAGAAAATGDSRLMRMFGAEAMAGGLSDLQRQKKAGVTEIGGQNIDEVIRRAAEGALAARGITDSRMTSMLAGQTAQEEAIRGRIRERAGALNTMGATMTDMAAMEVKSAQIKIDNAEVIFDKTMQSAAANIGGASDRKTNRMRNTPSRTPMVTGAGPRVTKWEAGGGWGTVLGGLGFGPQTNASRGGMIYADRGIFVPRGTDTVPAMLTPGEFVVRRDAVNRGSNLQTLRAMNSGNNASQMSGGGQVQYLQNGTPGSDGGPIQGLTDLARTLTAFNSELAKNIKNLKDMKFSIKLDSTLVKVKLDGAGFLKTMEENIRGELLKDIGTRLAGAKQRPDGTFDFTGQTVV